MKKITSIDELPYKHSILMRKIKSFCKLYRDYFENIPDDLTAKPEKRTKRAKLCFSVDKKDVQDNGLLGKIEDIAKATLSINPKFVQVYDWREFIENFD